MGRIYVDLRFGDIWDVCDFICIRNPQVELVAAQYAGLPKSDQVMALWKYVVEEINYPFRLNGAMDDTHVMRAFPQRAYAFFGTSYLIRKSQPDFWQLPQETITWRMGDCDDTSILLTSLLRANKLCSPEEVFCEAGFIGDMGHVWVNYQGQVLETTLDSLVDTPSPFPTGTRGYVADVQFNDQVSYGKQSIFGDPNTLLAVERIWGRPSKLRRGT